MAEPAPLTPKRILRVLEIDAELHRKDDGLLGVIFLDRPEERILAEREWNGPERFLAEWDKFDPELKREPRLLMAKMWDEVRSGRAAEALQTLEAYKKAWPDWDTVLHPAHYVRMAALLELGRFVEALSVMKDIFARLDQYRLVDEPEDEESYEDVIRWERFAFWLKEIATGLLDIRGGLSRRYWLRIRLARRIRSLSRHVLAEANALLKWFSQGENVTINKT